MARTSTGTSSPSARKRRKKCSRHAYTSGSVIGEGPLLDVPIILRNLYTDNVGDIHTRFHAFSIRDRLAAGRCRRSQPPVVDGADRRPRGAAARQRRRCERPDHAARRMAHDRYQARRPRRTVVYSPTARCSPAAGSCTTSRARARTSIRSTATRGSAAGKERRGDVIKCALTDIDFETYCRRVHRGTAGALGVDLPRRCVRLDATGRRPAAYGRLVARLWPVAEG